MSKKRADRETRVPPNSWRDLPRCCPTTTSPITRRPTPTSWTCRRRGSRHPPRWPRCAQSIRVDRVAHARGKAFRDVVLNLRGRLENVPDLIARPRHERDVIDVLDWCTGESIPVIPYGGGSSVVGGVEPRFDGPAVTVDLTDMDEVLEIDAVSRAARIQAGALGPDLENQLRPHGLTLRHFPQSFGFSTLGGWLATRAGGHFATLYTHIDDLTEALRVVTPAGVSESRRLPGSGAGPSGPDVPRFGGCTRRHHRGVDASARTAALAHDRVDHVRRLDRRGRRDPIDRTGRSVPDQLPAT